MNGRREARRSPLNSAARRRIEEAYSAHIRRRIEERAKLKRPDSDLSEAGVDAPVEEKHSASQNAGLDLLATARRYIAPNLGKALGGIASLAVFALAGFALASAISSVKFSDVRAAIAAMSAEQIFAALLLTALSYVALTGYDALALRQLRLHVPYRIAALASFASYAFSFNLGFPVVTAAAVRYWIYARVGVTAVQVANVTVIAGVTFWLGMTSVVGVGLMARAGELGAIDKLPAFLNFGLGLATCAGVGYYVVWVSLRRRRVRLRGHFFELPGLAPTGGQTLLGVADLCCAAAALYALLPHDVDLDFATFVSVYVFACILGVISHAPGGIGVFEATMLNALPSHSQESLLASLLLFRVIYYFLPFIFALALLGADEGSRRWNSLRETIARILETRE
nr:lysylphosphatidylglycerol synthase domain-containing protein [Methylosinus sp. C49]